MDSLGSILLIVICISLIILGTVSFMLFIRRIIINTSPKNESAQLNEKMDKIIELLEKQSK
ncbi:DUF4083 family protein [Viridibacillus sp. YIM B01967]|uniref:DUF4083 family protein n=1 Tax=Viridibacillus soli TaxID=2798301 RepID=A0ABS1HBT5_9BACL|nr:DUF4083 family protein [Viridibacillus soli]MBK3496856.1 DUF4083 family protein [Viridibacillus soli]